MLKFRFLKTRVLEDIEPHEILLDSLAEKKEQEINFYGPKLEIPLMKKILQVFFAFCFLVILGLFIKTFRLQVVEGEGFIQLAEKNKFIIHQIQAERGVIYDQKMEQLVFNKSTFDLVCPDEIIQNISYQDLILFEIKGPDEFPDCRIATNVARDYKDGEVFSHLIGYMGKIKSEEFAIAPEFYSINDYVGRDGVENFYERYLRKNPGKLRIEKDVFDRVISQEVLSLPESGKSLILWLNADLQRKAKTELENKYRELGAKGAVVIAMDPKSGGILSLISLPSFDNNLFQKGGDPQSLHSLLSDPQKVKPLFNRAISGRYLTGSTIKPFVAYAALEEKIITAEKQIYGSAYIEIPHRYDPEISYKFRDWTTHGWVDMRKAIAQSCNIYFYTIGGGYEEQKGLGPTKIKEYLELFGWTDKTGIDLPGEAAGFVPDMAWKRERFNEGWWDGNTYFLSIGQEFLQITPLEVTVAYTAIANNGVLYQPKVVKEIINGEKIEPQAVRQDFIDIKNIQVIKEGMRQAVTGFNSPQASAVILNSLPVSAAAKTGTAELGGDRYNNWVTVFAPYENPEIVLTVMIEDVKGVQAAALPVAKEILEWYFSSGRI